MFAIQRLSATLRPGKVEDGPPYKPPGNVWSTIARHGTLATAQSALSRVLAPALGTPASDPERYRIRRVK